MLAASESFLLDIIGRSTFWRIIWVLPCPFLLALLLSYPYQLFKEKGSRKTALLSSIITIIVIITVFSPETTFSGKRYPEINIPAIKAPNAYYHAEYLCQRNTSDNIILAPEKVSLWIPVIKNHPPAFISRLLYLKIMKPFIGQEEYSFRKTVANYISGIEYSENAKSLLIQAIEKLPIETVMVYQDNEWKDEIDIALKENNYKKCAGDEFVIYTKTKTNVK